jgi:hypothetical protein
MRIRSFTLASAALATSLVACDATSTYRASDEGGVRMALDIAPGTTLSAVQYAITGPGSFNKMGSIDVSASSTISTVISPLPPGTGYSITLGATSQDGSTMCMGSAPFDVASRQTTPVLVHLLCRQPTNNGSVAFNGAVNFCPLIDSLGVSPTEVVVGSAVTLAGHAHDADNGPAALTYQWTTSAGTLSDPAAPSPTLTCTSAGPVTVTLTVSDGDATCTDTQSLTVSCTPAGT